MSEPANKSDIFNLKEWMQESKKDTDRRLVEVSTKLTSYCEKNRQDHHEFYSLNRGNVKEISDVKQEVEKVKSNQKWFMIIGGAVWGLIVMVFGGLIAWVKTGK